MWYGWLLCLAVAIALETKLPTLPKRNPEGHSPRWWKKHPQAKARPEIGQASFALPAIKRSLKDHLWSWPVIGGIILLVLGGGISSMTSNHAIIADGFYAVGFGLLLAKFVTWHDSHRTLWSATIAALFMVALLGNHKLNGIYPFHTLAAPKPMSPTVTAEEAYCSSVMSLGQVLVPAAPRESKKVPNGELSKCRLNYRPEQLTLYDLFNTDFSHPPTTYTSSGAFKIITGKQKKMENIVDYTIVSQLGTATKFLVFYVWPTSEIFDVCAALSSKDQVLLNDRMINWKTTAKAATGDSEAASSEDTVFSKRVFIYHENYLALGQIIKIQTVFKKRGLSVILRGSDYLENQKLQAKLAMGKPSGK